MAALGSLTGTLAQTPVPTGSELQTTPTADEGDGFGWQATIAAVTASILSILGVIGAAWALWQRITRNRRSDEERLPAEPKFAEPRIERRDIWAEHRSLYELRIVVARNALESERDEARLEALADRYRRAQDEYLDLLDRAIKFPDTIDPSLRDSPEYAEFLKARLEEKTPSGKVTEAKEIASEKLADLRELLERIDRLGPAEETPEDHVTRGNAYYQAGQYQEALGEYNGTLQLRPDDPSTLMNRGVTLGQLQRYDEALADLDRALELRPDDPTTLYNRGLALSHLLRHAEALAVFSRALELRPDDTNTLRSRGLALANLGLHEEAIDTYNRTIELRPDHPDTLYNRGLSHALLSRYTDALTDFNRSLALRPDDSETFVARAVVLQNLGRHEEALADYNRALELRPDHPNTLYNRACLYSRWEKSAEALEDLRRAIAGDPSKRDLARTDPDFDNIRRDPRFRELVGEDAPPSEDSADS